MIEPEMMGHVLLHLNWKQFVFHRGCSFNLTSMREGRESRHTVFFTPLNPWEGEGEGGEREEEREGDEIEEITQSTQKRSDKENPLIKWYWVRRHTAYLYGQTPLI